MKVSTLTNGWTSIPLKFLFTHRVIGAWGEDPKDGEGLICIRAADFLTDKISHKITNLTRRDYDPREIVTRQLKPGDLIIEKSGGGDNQPVGRVVSFDLNEPALCSNFLELLRPDPKIIYSRFGAYLLYSLWSNRVVFAFIKQTTGIQNLDAEEYFSQEVSIPPVFTQIAIANYLDHETAKIDTLISAKERLLDLLTEKRRALITHALTCGVSPNIPMRDSGIEWIGKIPKHWEVEHLKYHIAKIEQGWSPQCDNFPADEYEWGVLKVGAVNAWEFNPEENKRLPVDLKPLTEYEIKPGDILISRANTTELVGSAALVDQVRSQLILCDKLYRLKMHGNRLYPEYLVFYLRSIAGRFEFERDATGASNSMQNISQEIVTNLWIPIPPIDEQHQIIDYIKTNVLKLDNLTVAAKRTIELLQERRTALITAAVTGQVKVTA